MMMIKKTGMWVVGDIDYDRINMGRGVLSGSLFGMKEWKGVRTYVRNVPTPFFYSSLVWNRSGSTPLFWSSSHASTSSQGTYTRLYDV